MFFIAVILVYWYDTWRIADFIQILNLDFLEAALDIKFHKGMLVEAITHASI